VPRTDPFAEADEDTGEIKQSNQSSYIHIRIQRTSSSLFPHILTALAASDGLVTQKKGGVC